MQVVGFRLGQLFYVDLLISLTLANAAANKFVSITDGITTSVIPVDNSDPTGGSVVFYISI